MARAKCIQDCFHGPTAWSYKTDGGENGDGWYDDIDPNDPIAKYFEFEDKETQAKVDEAAEKEAAEKEARFAKAKKAKK